MKSSIISALVVAISAFSLHAQTPAFERPSDRDAEIRTLRQELDTLSARLAALEAEKPAVVPPAASSVATTPVVPSVTVATTDAEKQDKQTLQDFWHVRSTAEISQINHSSSPIQQECWCMRKPQLPLASCIGGD